MGFLAKLEDLAGRKIPRTIGKPGDLQAQIEGVKKAGPLFLTSIVLFSASVAVSLLYIALSGVHVALIPTCLVAVGSYSGPILGASGVICFSWALWRWAKYYLFLLDQPSPRTSGGGRH